MERNFDDAKNCRKIAAFLCIFLLMLLGSAFAGTIEKPVYRVERGTIIREIRCLGQISGTVQRDLFFRSGGWVRMVRVQRGDKVKKDELLSELEVEDLKKKLAQGRIELETTELRLEEAGKENAYELTKAEIELANSESRLARAKAEDPKPRTAIAKANLDKAALTLRMVKINEQLSKTYENKPSYALQEATLNYQIALANYELALQAEERHSQEIRILENEIALAQLKVHHLKEGVDLLLQKQVDSARLSYERLELQVDDARIVAPFDGEIFSARLYVGNMIEAFDSAIILADPSKLEILVNLSSENIYTLTVEKKITFTSMDYPGKVFLGKVRRLPYLFDETGTISSSKTDRFVHIDFDQPEVDFKIGDLVRVNILLEKRDDVLYLSPAAIRTFRERKFVVVQEGERRIRVDVELGIQSEDRVEIKGDVLEEGQLVIGP